MSGAQSGAIGTRPVHDRPTWITYVQLGFWAWFLYGFGATNALLRDEQGTTATVAGFHGTSLAVGGFLAALLTTPAISRWGRGRTLRVSALLTCAAILLYTTPGAGLPVTLSGAFLASFFGTFLIISINAFLLDYQGPAGPTSLTEANALASMAGLIAPLAIGVGAATFLGWRAGIWIVVVGLLAVEIVRGRDVDTYGTKGLAAHEDAPGRLPRRVYWSLAMLSCFIGTEFCMTFWGADLLRERCGFGPAAAAASLATITGGMFLGRLGGSRLAQTMPTERLLKISIFVALGAFAVMWSFTVWPIVLTGMFLVGVGLGVHWPLGVARTVRASRGMTDRATATSSMAASFAIALAPILLGVLADAIGFQFAFLLVPVFLITALILLVTRPVPDLPPATPIPTTREW